MQEMIKRAKELLADGTVVRVSWLETLQTCPTIREPAFFEH
ncbi:MAG: hypothetical protein ACLUD2_10535 [Clostridium sp.]